MISKKLKEYHLENIVVDPVMVATSGSRLISETAIDTLKTQLLPMATVITPNIPEAEVLAEMEIRSEDDMVEAAKKIHEMYHCAVLCKGGHSLNDANDLLYQDGEATWFHGKRINNPNTHGTGCTLSSSNRIQSGKRIFSGRIYSPRERIYQRGVGSHVRSGKRKRTDGSWV